MPDAKLVLLRDGVPEHEFALKPGSVTLGRGAINDIVLADAKASRQHARLECTPSGCVVSDLGSVNGTRVNGAPVQRAMLVSGDMIGVGDATLRFEDGAPRPELEATLISSEAELEQTLAQETLPTRLNSTSEPRLVISTAARTWDLTLAGDAVTIGRGQDNAVVLLDPKASRRHAIVEPRGDGFVIRDLGSANGLQVAGRRVPEHRLADGDTVRIGGARLIYKRAFRPDDLDAGPVPDRPAGFRRPVVFVPGIMGSELWRGSELLWPNLRFLFTRPEEFLIADDNKLEARSVLGEVVIIPNLVKLAQYNRLGNYLEEGLGYERGRDLLEFPYDWRQDNRVSARALGKAIEEWQARGNDAARPLTIIAHSMGCLVTRYYVEKLGGKDRVERLIFLGGPHQGAPKAVTALLTGPRLLPFGLLGDRLRMLTSALPSLYQILPSYLCTVDQEGSKINVMADESWLEARQRPYLRDARAFRRELGARSSVPTVCIFGYGLKTMTVVRVLRNAERLWQKIDFDFEAGGDSTVPEGSAILQGAEIHPVEQYHGSLYTDNDVKMRLKLELTRKPANPSDLV